MSKCSQDGCDWISFILLGATLPLVEEFWEITMATSSTASKAISIQVMLYLLRYELF